MEKEPAPMSNGKLSYTSFLVKAGTEGETGYSIRDSALSTVYAQFHSLHEMYARVADDILTEADKKECDRIILKEPQHKWTLLPDEFALVTCTHSHNMFEISGVHLNVSARANTLEQALVSFAEAIQLAIAFDRQKDLCAETLDPLIH